MRVRSSQMDQVKLKNIAHAQVGTTMCEFGPRNSGILCFLENRVWKTLKLPEHLRKWSAGALAWLKLLGGTSSNCQLSQTLLVMIGMCSEITSSDED